MSVHPDRQDFEHREPTPATFKMFASQWPSGVAVVTTADADGRPRGLAMTAVMSLSLEPMQFLISVDNGSSTLPAILTTRKFGINMLGEDQADICRAFARKTDDKFAGLGWSRDAHGLPVLAGAVAYAGCDVVAVHDGGDHRIVIGRLVTVAVPGGAPLIYHCGEFRAARNG